MIEMRLKIKSFKLTSAPRSIKNLTISFEFAWIAKPRAIINIK